MKKSKKTIVIKERFYLCVQCISKAWQKSKKLFSANGNKSEVVDDDEIYTLKPYFPIFIAKKAGKNEWLRTGKKGSQKRPYI